MERPWWSYISIRLQIFVISCKVEIVKLSLIIIVFFIFHQFTLYFYTIFTLEIICFFIFLNTCKFVRFLTCLRFSNFRFKANLALINCDKIFIVVHFTNFICERFKIGEIHVVTPHLLNKYCLGNVII